jgi:hypothetical protein
MAYREPPGIDRRWFSLRAGQNRHRTAIHKVAFSQSYPTHPGAAVKQLTTMGMCLMNGYEVFKVQTHPPHKRGSGEGLSVAFHLMH